MARRTKSSNADQPDKDSLFLIRYAEMPIMVPREEPLGMGRSDENGVIIGESRVSRRHACIAWDPKENAYKIEDLTSANGTYLNGERLNPGESVLVKDGDKIRITSTVFTARIGADTSALESELRNMRQKAQFKATVVMRREDLMNAEKEPAFTGDLQHLCPLELLQILDTSVKTGHLTLCTPQGTGVLFIEKGQVISAAFDEATGEDAVYEFLPCNEGTFAFTPHPSDGVPREIDVTTAFLLMEGCRRMDEASMPRSAGGAS